MILSFILAAAVIVLVLLVVKPTRVIYIKALSLPAICVLFIICIVIFSNTAVKSALDGLILWASIVVPSLFPFFTASELMNSTGFTRAAGVLLEPVMRPFFNVPGCASFALALGVTSGYPVGAKITADLRKNGSLTKLEAERLLAFTNNSGPLFIIGAVGTGMFGSASIGLFLFICHLLSCITVGLIFRYYKRRLPGNQKDRSSLRTISKKEKNYFKKNKMHNFKSLLTAVDTKKINFGELLGSAIKNSVSTILAIGGFIVLFSVIISLLNQSGIIGIISVSISRLLQPLLPNMPLRDPISGVLGGLFEITTGSKLVSQGSSVPLTLKLPAVSFLIGWAGLSVHFQVMSIVSETDINIRPYLLGKLLQGIIASIYTLLGIRLTGVVSPAAEPAPAVATMNFHGFFSSIGNSLLLLITVVAMWYLFYYSINTGHIGSRPKKKSSI